MSRKGIFRVFILIGLITSIQTKGSTILSEKKTDSLSTRSINSLPKSGFNLAPFPEFMIDPVVGVYFGINFSLFDYGDGKDYPNYRQFFNLNAAWGTKGKTNLSFRYKKFGNQLFALNISYSFSNLYPFYGFNGYQTYYSEEFVTPSSPNFITSPFYNYTQEKTKIDVYVQDKIAQSDVNWFIGFDLSYYAIDRIDFNKIYDRAESNNSMDDLPTLYDHYIEWNLIDQNEKSGGWANSIRAALIYDTRNRLCNPSKGVWSEATLRYTPSFFGNPNSGIQLAVTHHQFFTLVPNRLIFAYRLRYDAAFNELAFYTKQVLADGTEGYGGTHGMVGEGFGTIWGIEQNRVVGKQMALGNFELRARLIQFRLFNQNWHLALVPLFHTGVILEPYAVDLSNVSEEDQQTYFRSSYKGWYSAAGIGGKLVMNENIVIGLDWAHALNKQAGSNAFYVGMGYTF
jgi:outer membrane protein assembly factor BamA